ncbi:MAG: hypothetical protein AAB424_02455 [Patescibacteria group bacterium]
MPQPNPHVYFTALPPLPLLRVYALELCIDGDLTCVAEMPRLDDDVLFHIGEAERELLLHCVQRTISARALMTVEPSELEAIRDDLRARYPIGQRAIVELTKIAHARKVPRSSIRDARRLPGWVSALQFHGHPFLRKKESLPNPITWTNAHWGEYFHTFTADEYRLVIFSAARAIARHTPSWYTDTAFQLFAPCFLKR